MLTPILAAAQAASVPAWPPPTTITSNAGLPGFPPAFMLYLAQIHTINLKLYLLCQKKTTTDNDNCIGK